jgi:hypothetical protein
MTYLIRRSRVLELATLGAKEFSLNLRLMPLRLQFSTAKTGKKKALLQE